MKNGEMWFDIDGNPIQSHGGCIIYFEGLYYWYGENKGQDNTPNKTRVDVIGVSCYSSKDLLNWKFEGLIIESDKDNVTSPLHYSKVLERPKVIYNTKNKQFVLWMHLDNADYTYAGVGVAVSDKPNGKFKLIDVFRPNNQESRDMTIYKDKDDSAWLISSKDGNKTLSITRLNEDYLSLDSFNIAALIDQEREAPSLFYYEGKYYMITSGCTGWAPNTALVAESSAIEGQWKLINNPCLGKNNEKTFYGQSSYIFEAKGNFYLMLDHWKPFDLKNSGYSILPIKINKVKFSDLYEPVNVVTVPWEEEWKGIIQHKND